MPRAAGYVARRYSNRRGRHAPRSGVVARYSIFGSIIWLLTGAYRNKPRLVVEIKESMSVLLQFSYFI
jgi:hypothetical protein